MKTDILVRSMGPICERDMVSAKVLVHGSIQIKHNHKWLPPREEIDPLCPIASQWTCTYLESFFRRGSKFDNVFFFCFFLVDKGIEDVWLLKLAM